MKFIFTVPLSLIIFLFLCVFMFCCVLGPSLFSYKPHLVSLCLDLIFFCITQEIYIMKICCFATNKVVLILKKKI